MHVNSQTGFALSMRAVLKYAGSKFTHRPLYLENFMSFRMEMNNVGMFKFIGQRIHFWKYVPFVGGSDIAVYNRSEEGS